MKKLTILPFLFLSILSFCQTDSLEIRLKRYKNLYDNNLITPQEYEQLKLRELSLGIKKPIKSKEAEEMITLKKRFSGEFTGASILFVTSAVLIGTSIHNKNKIIYPNQIDSAGNPNPTAYQKQLDSKNEKSLVLGLLGGCNRSCFCGAIYYGCL